VGTMSRRSFLFTTAAVSLPPLVTGLGVAKGLSELSKFRIRRFTVSIPGLPSALEGLTIAHLSDTHVGHFTPARALPAIADATNELNADLILFTGDLIDFAIADLPRAMDFLKQLHHPDRLFLCEGNHDLFESRDRFENDLKDAGFNLLLNEAPVVGVRGHPVQILGLQWGLAPSRRSANIEQHFMQALSLRNLQAFPILLAHHPHAFDLAAEVGIPLTLAGHTHGGQLMLTETIGPGPMMFKYYSGLYRKGNSSLVVSNGTGNWFPLRLNAPAEIVHLTLVGGSSANG
jgi:predicted MPP superfamily phosphohydrolase